MDLVGESEGKKKFRRPRRQWEDNIRVDLQEIGRRLWKTLSSLSIETGGGLL
jgi:hypothetical protein